MPGITGIDRNHLAQLDPMLAAQAFEMTRVGGEAIVNAHKAAAMALLEHVPVDGASAEVMPGDSLSKPPLMAPRAPLPKGMNSAATLTLLLGELAGLLGEAGQSELEGRIGVFKEASAARQKSMEKVSKEFSDAVAEAEHAVEQYEAARSQLAAAEADYVGAYDRAQAAGAELAALEPDDPARPQALGAHDATQERLASATQRYGSAVELEKNRSADAMQKVTASIEIEVQAKQSTTGAPLQEHVEREIGSSSARLSLLMAELSQMVSDIGEKGAESDRELLSKMQKERQTAMESEARKYDEEVKKAEEINRTMGCIGKIVGAVLTVVSIVAIPFTGGASAVLAVVGLGMMAADAITKAVTGESLTEMAMAPVMEHVVAPLMEKLSGLIAEALEKMGVDSETAQKAGAIVAAVAVAVALVAVVFTVAAVAKNLATKMIEKFAKPMVRMMTKMASKAGKKFSETTLRRTQTYAKIATTGLDAGATAVETGGNVSTGYFVKEAKHREANIVVTSAMLALIKDMFKQAAEHFSTSLEATRKLTVGAADIGQMSAQAGHAVLRNRMRA